MQNIIGKTIGDYHILEPIEEGGVATVYRAKSRATGQLVAFKLLKPESLNIEQLSKRFVQEMEIMAGLKHPHIIKVLNTGNYDAQPFMVLEYASNGSLAEHTQDFTLHDIAKILRQVASALDYAHVRNTVHRDIKLENILLDDKGNVRLIDFGLAKNFDTNELQTGTGVILGTPYYFSPEQCLYKAVDARSDIYSLGVTIYYLLTGEFPFTAQAPALVMIKHIQDPAPLITSFKPDLSDSLAQVIDKTLSKSPDDRYQSAGDFSSAFETAIGITTSEDTSPSWFSSLPPIVSFIAIILIVMIIGVTFLSLLSAVPAG